MRAEAITYCHLSVFFNCKTERNSRSFTGLLEATSESLHSDPLFADLVKRVGL
jgi:hypothetical protein